MQWKDAVHHQRTALARLLHEPVARLAGFCVRAWGNRLQLNDVLAAGFVGIPHATYLYALDDQGVQISDNVAAQRLVSGYFGRDRSSRPYMREPVPAWGFLLSDAYVSQSGRPSLTALHVVRDGDVMLGYLGADFDLRDLPTSEVMLDASRAWRQIKGDPSIRGALFLQDRVEGPMDGNIGQTLAVLQDLITERGMFHVVIHFSSSVVTGWFVSDPFRYRILDHEALSDPDICLLYRTQPWPADAEARPEAIGPVLDAMRELRTLDRNIYLRSATINIFNGMVSLTFSCDGTHYLSCSEFLDRRGDFWSSMGYEPNAHEEGSHHPEK
uniref:Uncharacterized protein n=1 Tax=Candidatus Kentrum sp. SD TaxID=2126332 RepID=A0A450Z3Q7_9GAMM|nr:MAG: hypothetical protein BECKSD772F_GA0070984_112712 [Candidatus Kentron sp. SD]VFK48338.1 MAG: hypothetical protein BECKSD772E_GA0070983_112112 [Candidatus Kentron sp. SD]VFK78314.1 MAG: hypothetical protein BECKSD772D_GA0070982_101147 [Candidatus Kentron sp. SD]